MSQKEKNVKSDIRTNSRTRDNSSKVIFEDPILCAQFLRGYLDIPLLSEVQPEDIEDVTERYLPMFSEERDSDIVKRVKLKNDGTPCFFISLIEHKSKVDYNVVMQIFRYMAFIWEDYEKEQEKLRKGISRTRGFQYPPILPVIFYDGAANWTAPLRFHDKILCSDVLGEFIPDYRCLLMQLKDYSNEQLMKKKDELSLVMLIDKLRKASDFTRIGKEISKEYLDGVMEETPGYLLEIMARVITMLLLKINVPYEEAADFAEQVKERQMGELFANFEAYDVQATRREAREEAREEDIRILVEILQGLGGSREAAKRVLMERYGMGEKSAEEKLEECWKRETEKERQMGELFANFEAYDVQATRREAREEAREEDIRILVETVQKLGGSREAAKRVLMERYGMDGKPAEEKLEECWKRETEKERQMGELFANFEAYDVQATRREAREEAREEDIRILVETLQGLGGSREAAKRVLMERYGMGEKSAEEKLEECWMAGTGAEGQGCES